MNIKRMLRSIAKAGWAGIGPVRRPLIRKFQRSVVDEIGRRVAQHVHTAPASTTLQDIDLVLDSMVRELTRLQAQVEVLQLQVEELTSVTRDAARPESRLSVVGETG
jgi:hypothetical protein